MTAGDALSFRHDKGNGLRRHIRESWELSYPLGLVGNGAFTHAHPFQTRRHTSETYPIDPEVNSPPTNLELTISSINVVSAVLALRKHF